MALTDTIKSFKRLFFIFFFKGNTEFRNDYIFCSWFAAIFGHMYICMEIITVCVPIEDKVSYLFGQQLS